MAWRINGSSLGKLGDTVLIEPAITALCTHTDEPARVHIDPQFHILFKNHPYIIPEASALDDPNYIVSADKAFHWSHDNNALFTQGFFHQLGLNWVPGDRLHFKYHQLLELILYDYLETITFIPYGFSCSGRTPGNRPNVQPPREWWDSIITSLSLHPETSSYKIQIICSNNYEWCPSFKDARVTEIRGLTFPSIMNHLFSTTCVVTVETGILHLLTAAQANVVFLSCATPPTFCRPGTTHEMIRASFADEFNQQETIDAIVKMVRGRKGL